MKLSCKFNLIELLGTNERNIKQLKDPKSWLAFMFRMNENMEFPGASGDDIEWLQDQFVGSIKVGCMIILAQL